MANLEGPRGSKAPRPCATAKLVACGSSRVTMNCRVSRIVSTLCLVSSMTLVASHYLPQNCALSVLHINVADVATHGHCKKRGSGHWKWGGFPAVAQG